VTEWVVKFFWTGLLGKFWLMLYTGIDNFLIASTFILGSALLYLEILLTCICDGFTSFCSVFSGRFFSFEETTHWVLFLWFGSFRLRCSISVLECFLSCFCIALYDPLELLDCSSYTFIRIFGLSMGVCTVSVFPVLICITDNFEFGCDWVIMLGVQISSAILSFISWCGSWVAPLDVTWLPRPSPIL